MTRLKAFVTNVIEAGGDEPQPFIALEYIESGTGSLLPGVELPEKIDPNAITHQPGDVRFGKLRPYLAKSVLMESRGIGSGELLVLRPMSSALEPRFLWYLTLSKPFLEWAEVTSYGVKMPRTNWTLLGAWDAWIPPIDEQRRLVEFLDGKVGQLDKLFAEQEQLLHSMKQRHYAFVSMLLGAHLGGAPRPLESALADLPETWRVVPLKHVATIQSGLTLGKRFDGDVSEYPYLRVANVRDGVIDTTDVASVDVPALTADRHLLRADDVLMTEGGDNDKLGRGSLWNGEISPCLHQNHIFAVRTTALLKPRFLAALLSSAWGRAYFTATAHQATNLASTNRSKVGSFPIPLPPVNEQLALLAEIDEETARVVAVVNEVEHQLELLREHRQALITAAVTGQLDAARSAA